VWKAGLPDDYYEALARGSGRVAIASSKEDQFSFIRPQGDLSLFTYHMSDDNYNYPLMTIKNAH
jgi:hypothetical protein